MALPVWCTEYFGLMDADPDHFCKEQWAMRRQVEKAYQEEDLVWYTPRFEKYMGMAKYLGYGKGYEWERFLIGCFLCTYKKDGSPRWRRLLVYMGRGGGKDGCISLMSLCLVSPYNPVKNYDVDIGAYNETQALRPIEDVREALKDNEKLFKKYFRWTKEIIQSTKTKARLRGWANNSKGLDGLRSGAVFLDEVHAYENTKTIEVFTSGLGKVEDPRIGYFTTEGYIQDGPLDELVKTAHDCLFDGEPDDGWLYFMCKLDSVDEVHDEDKWHKANPSLIHKPSLMQELRDMYKEWKRSPGQNKDFLCKRMNLKQTQSASPVAQQSDIAATNKPLPATGDLYGHDCIVGIDFAKTTDWCGVDFHFRQGDERIDFNHAFVCLQSDQLWRLKCPYEEWADKGDLTLVNEPEIAPKLIADYIHEQADLHGWNIRCICIDSYRYSLMTDALKEYGWTVKDKTVYLTRPSDQIRVAPVILRCFVNHLFTWGDTPHLRWATNNACLVPAKKSRMAENGELDMGNYLFGKQEPHARKTDPFMALVAAMAKDDELTEPEITEWSCGFFGW